MATPTLRAIRDQYPNAEIVAVMRPYVAEVLEGLELVDRNLLYNPRGKDRSQRGLPFIQKLRREQFDVALLLPNSIRTGWLAFISGAKRRIGFSRDGRGLLLTDRVKPQDRSAPNPVIDEYLRLAKQLGCKGSATHVDHRLSREMFLAATEQDELHLEEFWQRESGSKLADSMPLSTDGYICLNPGGAFGAAKHWPSASFGQLANRIATELNKTVLVLCGPNEKDEARQIVQTADNSNVVSFANHETSIGLTKAAVKHCDLLITTDSGPRHFAAPFGVPVVTLFGPTHIAWSETFSSKSIHLQLEVDCGPCQQRVCPLQHHRCMTELEPDRVFKAAVSLLERQQRHAA